MERRGDVVAVPVSYYAYRPQTVADVRTEFVIPIGDFLNPARMLQYMAETPEGHEMAVHSNLVLADQAHMHLVMVDMSTAAKAHLEKLRMFLGDNFFQEIAWFGSGRSFHGYGASLLSSEDWVKFMGLLLLANQPRFEPTVDPRWIGHRLMAGYASLRWTKNTSYYRGLPIRIEKPTLGDSSPVEAAPIGIKIGPRRSS